MDTIKTEKGIDLRVITQDFDGMTNRISLGGDDRGYYLVTRTKMASESIRVMETVLNSFRSHTIKLASELAKTSAVNSHVKGRESLETRITKLVSRAIQDTRGLDDKYPNEEDSKQLADTLNSLLEHTTNEILNEIRKI